MVSCYDCEHFGIYCKGVVPPIEFRDRIDEFCDRFAVVRWRGELNKGDGQSRI